MPALAALE
ncbi:hypothetical protein D030_3723A, partial [Vibrio parahaemolyticus AQ3810]